MWLTAVRDVAIVLLALESLVIRHIVGRYVDADPLNWCACCAKRSRRC
jgi:hypothetical protein